MDKKREREKVKTWVGNGGIQKRQKEDGENEEEGISERKKREERRKEEEKNKEKR